MSTINKIIKDSWYTLSDIKMYENLWIANWFWPWCCNMNWLFKILHNFSKDNEQKLIADINICADIHDINYYHSKWFIKSNYKFAYDVMRLLHWTNIFWRLFIFLILFLSTTLFGWLFYNWTWNKK